MEKVSVFLRNLSIFTVLALTFFSLCPSPALAHGPHDVISQLEISPNYEQNSNVFIIVREKFLKSTDGGASWTRVVKGIDNRYPLSVLAASPSNPKVLYISSLGDGIYKSEDEGNSWFKVNKGLNNLAIDRIVISPESDDLVLAAGSDRGLYLTENGGQLWSTVLDTSEKITAIASSSEKRGQWFIGTDKGVFYGSTDSGKTWTENFRFSKTGTITAISISPDFDSDRTAIVGTEKSGLFKTVDGGTSFSEINKGISDLQIEDIAFARPNSLFVATWNEGIWLSSNGGETWKKMARGLTKESQADEEKFNSPHFSDLEISENFAQDKTMFLAGFDGLFKSNDGGETWNQLETLSTRVITTLAVSPNYANDSTVAIGNYMKEGYISTDRGKTWSDITAGLDVPRYKKGEKNPIAINWSRFFEIAFSPNYQSDNTIFAALSYNFVKSSNRGKTWTQIPLKSVSGDSLRELLIATSPNFARDRTIYLSTYRGTIYRSTNAGSKFSVVGKVGHEVRSLVLSPAFASDQTLYAGGLEGVYKSVDAGATWQSTTQDASLKAKIWYQVAISPNYSVDRTVVAATDLGLWVTRDGGQSWNQLTGDYGSERFIEAVAISPDYQNDQTIIASVQGQGLYKTVDGGQTFTAIGEELIDRNHTFSQMVVSTMSVPIRFSPAYAEDRTIYGFGSAKAEVYKSTDGGLTWEFIEVPRNENKIDRLMTSAKVINLVLTIYPVLKFLVAGVAAMLVYWLSGYAKRRKRLPLSKIQIKIGASLVAFLLVSILLFI